MADIVSFIMQKEPLKRWMCHIKSKTVCELQIQQRRINPTNPTHSHWGAKSCGISRCSSCELLCSCRNITRTVTNKTHGIIGNLNCSSSNIICVYECLHSYKQYIGESNGEVRVIMNSHGYAINSKYWSHLYICNLCVINGFRKLFIQYLT